MVDPAAVDDRQRDRQPSLHGDALRLNLELAECDRGGVLLVAGSQGQRAEPESQQSQFQGMTSNRPDQPSSANSVLWAWNMNLPGCLYRNSRMPRCPWPWTLVS